MTYQLIAYQLPIDYSLISSISYPWINKDDTDDDDEDDDKITSKILSSSYDSFKTVHLSLFSMRGMTRVVQRCQTTILLQLKNQMI